MPSTSIYLKHEITIKDLCARYATDSRASLSNKWWFVGIDIAPNDNLETGVAVIDRERRVMRMDKMDSDGQILEFLQNLSRSENILVALDIPKSLSIVSKWRQQQVKMHPLRLNETAPGEWREPVPSDRYAQRAKDFYEALEKRGILTFGFFAGHAKLRYALNSPFRHRSSAGCRALQASLKQKLAIKDIPSNLAPSSVLDAMIAAYTSWLVCYGKPEEHYRLFQDDEQRLYIDPLKRTRLARSRER